MTKLRNHMKELQMTHIPFALLVSSTGCAGQSSPGGSRYIGYQSEGHIRAQVRPDNPELRAKREWLNMMDRTRRHVRAYLSRHAELTDAIRRTPTVGLPVKRGAVEVFVLKHSFTSFVQDLTVDATGKRHDVLAAVQPLVEQLVLAVLEVVEECATARSDAKGSLSQGEIDHE